MVIYNSPKWEMQLVINNSWLSLSVCRVRVQELSGNIDEMRGEENPACRHLYFQFCTVSN